MSQTNPESEMQLATPDTIDELVLTALGSPVGEPLVSGATQGEGAFEGTISVKGGMAVDEYGDPAPDAVTSNLGFIVHRVPNGNPDGSPAVTTYRMGNEDGHPVLEKRFRAVSDQEAQWLIGALRHARQTADRN